MPYYGGGGGGGGGVTVGVEGGGTSSPCHIPSLPHMTLIHMVQ